jgi:hypothetical protein
MAKRKERALAKTASKRGKAGKKVKSTPRKSAKRTGAKVSAKKAAQRVAAKTKTKKLGTKPRAKQARPTEPSTKADEGTEETIIVDIVEPAVPGVVVVTEFESVRTNGPEAPSPQPEGE